MRLLSCKTWNSPPSFVKALSDFSVPDDSLPWLIILIYRIIWTAEYFSILYSNTMYKHELSFFLISMEFEWSSPINLIWEEIQIALGNLNISEYQT